VLSKLPTAAQHGIMLSITETIQTVFLVGVPIAVFAFGLSWLLPEVELRTTVRANKDFGEATAAPESRSSLEEVEIALERVIASQDRGAVYADLARRAALDLGPQACWLLFRLSESPGSDRAALEQRYAAGGGSLRAGLDELASGGCVTEGAGGEITITDEGRRAMAALTESRREGLVQLLDGWDPMEHEELEALVRRLATTLLADDDALLEAARPSGT
jgi:hypothetical protein